MSKKRPLVIRLELPAVYASLNVLGACIVELLAEFEAIDNRDITIYGIRLATHETCTNIIDHAYQDSEDGRIGVTLTLEYTPQRIVIELEDKGKRFEINEIPSPNLEVPQEHGYGLFLMRSLMDEVTYTPRSEHNYWRLVKNL